MKTGFLHPYVVLRMFVRLSLAAFLLLTMLGMYLSIFGLPDIVVRRINPLYTGSGWRLYVEGVKLTVHGWQIKGLHLYHDISDDLHPIIQVERLAINRHTVHGFFENDEPLQIHCTGVDILPATAWSLPDMPFDGPVNLDRCAFKLVCEPDACRFEEGWIKTGFLQVSFNGVVHDFSEWQPSGNKQERLGNLLRMILKYKGGAQGYMEEFVTLPERLQGNLQFSLQCANLRDSRVDFSLSCEDMWIDELDIEEVTLSGAFVYPKLEIEEFQIKRGKNAFECVGAVDVFSGEVDMDVINAIENMPVNACLPSFIRRRLLDMGVRIERIPMFELHIGPSPCNRFFDRFSGRFNAASFSHKGTSVQKASGRVERNGNRWKVEGLMLDVNRSEVTMGSILGPNERNTIRGSLHVDTGTRELKIEASGTADPRVLDASLKDLWVHSHILGEFEFGKTHPTWSFSMRSSYDDWRNASVRIELEDEQVVYRAVPFDAFNVVIRYENRRLMLDDLHATRSDRFLKGSSILDFENKVVRFNLTGSLCLEVLQNLIRPNWAWFNFGMDWGVAGETDYTLNGVLNWDRLDQCDFAAHLQTERFKWNEVALNELTVVISGKGHLLSGLATFSSLGGTAQFSGYFPIGRSTGSRECQASFKVENIEMDQLIRMNKRATGRSLQGRLATEGSLSFLMDSGRFEAEQGGCHLKIDGGVLTGLPFLRGLSGVIRSVWPPLDIFSIASIEGDIAFSNQTFFSSNMRMNGNLFGATAQGAYALDRGFDAKVKIHMSDDSEVKRLLRAVTRPFMQFFDLSLTGTFNDPVWRLNKLDSVMSPF